MGDPTVRVMSFNVRVATLLDLHNHWGFRKDVLARTVRRFEPDVLGTQECLPDQAADLTERLPGYRMVGAGRDDGAEDGEMCAIFYRADRFRKLDAGHFWLSERPERPGSRSWGAWFPRMVSWVKLQRTDGNSESAGTGSAGQTFFVFNTHFAVTSGRARRRSARLLRKRAAALAGDQPFIVTGDFNAGEGSAPYNLLVGGAASRGVRPAADTGAEPAAGLVDAFRQAHPHQRKELGTRHGFRGGGGGARIDWILHTPHFRTLDAAIDRYHVSGRYPSDHYPVEAILQLDAPQPRHASTNADPASE